MYREDTIAAVATATGEAGVAVIRVSGPDAEGIARKIFVRAQGKNGKLKSHTLYHGTIAEPEGGKILDDVLLAIMRKPRSYTGEDVIEVHCHGGTIVVRRILGLILSQGARHAEPGEFTKRAFLNGRVDLIQAEAVLELIRARTDKGADLALGQVRGELSQWVGALREGLLHVLVQIEAAIDFPEEEIEFLQRGRLVAKIEGITSKIREISGTYAVGKLLREGARVCICGRPNVGKSSLMNRLLGEERVIVTAAPGTTRDVIEEAINLNGVPLTLWDTAGIRATADEVESVGVALTQRHIEKADAVICVLDGSEVLSDEDLALLDAIEGKKKLIAVNKSDLPQKIDTETVLKAAGAAEVVSFSAKEGLGMEALKDSLRDLITASNSQPAIVLTNVRHRVALLRGERALRDAISALKELRPPEIVAVNLQEACESLEEIIGTVRSQDVLERIFASFCIGK